MTEQPKSPTIQITYAPASTPPARYDLVFPLTIDGREVATVTMLPPTFEAVRFLSRLDAVEAPDILQAVADLPPEITEAIRWPDIEGALAIALKLLPPDLAARFQSAGEDGPAAGVPASGVAFEPGPQQVGIDAGADEIVGLGPADFMSLEDMVSYG